MSQQAAKVPKSYSSFSTQRDKPWTTWRRMARDFHAPLHISQPKTRTDGKREFLIAANDVGNSVRCEVRKSYLSSRRKRRYFNDVTTIGPCVPIWLNSMTSDAAERRRALQRIRAGDSKSDNGKWLAKWSELLWKRRSSNRSSKNKSKRLE